MKKQQIKTVEQQYQFYLGLMKLDESQMHPIQRKQLRDSFFGAWGQLLLSMRDEVSMLEEEEGIEVLEAQKNEVANHWLNRSSKQN